MSRLLAAYRKKRNLKKSSEPKAVVPTRKKKKHIFVIQKHKASRLHYDFRLEADGVLKSWAVPKNLSKKIGEKRLAVKVEDHPLAYAKFHGTIPKGHYGAGTVEIWDKGTYTNLKTLKNGKEKSLRSCIRNGRIEISLSGKKMKGGYALIQMSGKNWLIFKMKKRL